MTVSGVRLLSASSVTQCTCNVTYQGQHAMGQSCYVPLGRHLIISYNDFGHEVVAGKSIPHAGFGSPCPSARPHSTTRIR